MRVLKIIINVIIFCLLTILTQIGGIIYLLSTLTYKFTDKYSNKKVLKLAFRFATFIILYSLLSFIIIPKIANLFGRVPLPIQSSGNLKPLNHLTVILNRNYVKPELKQVIISIANQMNSKYPGSKLNYLDANFPFFDGFPLIPHLSHND